MYLHIVKNTLPNRHIESQKGFTLIELMIVVSIIGILSVVAIPSHQEYIRKAQMAEGYIMVSTATKAQIANFNSWGYFGGMETLANGNQYEIPESKKFSIELRTNFLAPDVKSRYIGFLDGVITPGATSHFILSSINGFYNNGGAHSYMSPFAASGVKAASRPNSNVALFKGQVGSKRDALGINVTAIGVQGLPNEHYSFSSAHGTMGTKKLISLFQLVKAYNSHTSVSPIIEVAFPIGEAPTLGR